MRNKSFMSSSYNGRGTRRYGAWGHWIPLVATVTVATVGIAAWMWSQRGNDDDHNADADDAALYQDLDYENVDDGDKAPCGIMDPRLDPPPLSGPHKILDSARKTVAAGVTAASAAMGSALAVIREEEKKAHTDHETWLEAADANKKGKDSSKPERSPRGGKKRKVVALVVAAEGQIGDLDGDGFVEHASVLSHIPRNNDLSSVKLFILVYAPGLKDTAPDMANNLPPPSLSSSFSNIEHNQAQEAKSPLMQCTDPTFHAIFSQAVGLVEKESMVLPFTTPNGYVYILRHLQPELVYLQESLAGENGSVMAQLQTWLRHDLVVIIGAEGGHGGLADSESEAEKPETAAEKWWQRDDRVGRGRGVVVVDGTRVHDDWVRRVQGRE